MYLDTINDILNNNILEGDLNLAIIIIKLLCNKFNFKNNFTLKEKFEIKFYLQNKLKFEIKNELIEYHKNYTSEINYYNNMFNLENETIQFPNMKYVYTKNKYSNLPYNKLDKINLPYNNLNKINLPIYSNRIIIYNNIINKTANCNEYGISKKDIEYWNINFEDNFNNYFIDIRKKMYHNENLYIKILNVIYYELSLKYDINYYLNIKESIFSLLNKFNKREDVNNLIRNIQDIMKYSNINYC